MIAGISKISVQRILCIGFLLAASLVQAKPKKKPSPPQPSPPAESPPTPPPPTTTPTPTPTPPQTAPQDSDPSETGSTAPNDENAAPTEAKPKPLEQASLILPEEPVILPTVSASANLGGGLFPPEKWPLSWEPQTAATKDTAQVAWQQVTPESLRKLVEEPPVQSARVRDPWHFLSHDVHQACETFLRDRFPANSPRHPELGVLVIPPQAAKLELSKLVNAWFPNTQALLISVAAEEDSGIEIVANETFQALHPKDTLQSFLASEAKHRQAQLPWQDRMQMLLVQMSLPAAFPPNPAAVAAHSQQSQENQQNLASYLSLLQNKPYVPLALLGGLAFWISWANKRRKQTKVATTAATEPLQRLTQREPSPEPSTQPTTEPIAIQTEGPRQLPPTDFTPRLGGVSCGGHLASLKF